MTRHNKKQYGVWMDTHQALIVGRKDIDAGAFEVIGKVENPGAEKDPSEKSAHHREIGLTQKYFKEIAANMPNVDEIHVTGTGQIQEEFIHFLRDTPQYKNAVATESTSNKLTEVDLVKLISKYFE